MSRSRRELLAGAAAATVGVALVGAPVAARGGEPVSPDAIAQLFAGVPGTVTYKILAPATTRTSRVDISAGADQQLFIGSAFKALVLAEALRQADAPDVVNTITAQQLDLDATVWSPDSATFNPPNLTGSVSERTAMEAMILHSDNTGADMILKHVGADDVRSFIASAGLTKTLIPTSTRIFIGYLLGAPDYEGFTWEQYEQLGSDPYVNPALNQTETMASSCADLVSFYSRSLQGEFFVNPETLDEYRIILSIGDIIGLLPMPLGVSAFAKGGEINQPGFHALSAAGGMYFDDVWVYFSFMVNWDAPGQSDPATQEAWAKAAAGALQLVKDSLAAPTVARAGGRLPATT